MATRQGFNPDADPAIDNAPAVRSSTNRCFADGCPMPGSIRSGSSWCCAWHLGAKPEDIPRITQAMKDWECVTYEINVARQTFIGKHASSPKMQNEIFAEAVERLDAAAGKGGWDTRPKPGVSYDAWMRELQHFLDRRIREVIEPRRQA